MCCNFKKKASFIYLLSQFQNNYFKWNRIQGLPIFSCSLWRNNLPGMKVSTGFYSRSSNGLTIHHRQPSKDVIFNRQPPKMQSKINRQKVSRCLNLTISADLDGIPAPKEFLNWKNQYVLLLKNTLSRQYSTLQPAYIWEYFEI